MDDTGRRPAGEVGLTLVEVVVAVVLLTLVTTASLPAVVAALRATRDAPVLTGATQIAERELEIARATPCARLPWDETTAVSLSGAAPSEWEVTGRATPVSFTGDPRRPWRSADTTSAQACAVDATGGPASTAPFHYTTTVSSLARPGVSVTLTTSIFQGDLG